MRAGWLSKEHYGSDNALFQFDVQNSYVDAATKAVVAAGFSEHDVDAHADNLQVRLPCGVFFSPLRHV